VRRIQCVQKKVSPPNILHWQVQTCPVLNKIKHALAQKYPSYCRQISYDSILLFNRFSIFTNCCHRFQLPTWLAYYARCTCVTNDVILLMNKMLSKKDRVLIKVLGVEKGYGAKRIMTEFPERNFSLASVKRLLHQTDRPSLQTARVCRPQVRQWLMSHCTHERDSCTAFSWDTRLHRSTVLATKQPGPQSGRLRGLGHFARASLPLLDPWRRPSERTTDCRMAPIWPEYHWQSCQPMVAATAWMCQRERRTIWA